MGIVVWGRFILASASPRRVELLKLTGLQFEVIPGCVNEAYMKGETPEEHVLRLSEEKVQVTAAPIPRGLGVGGGYHCHH